MKRVLSIYKPIGLTPLQLITKLRSNNPEYEHLKIGFAGRLDPLAHGVMLFMLGEETKNRTKYLGLPKEYEFEVLFGVVTDTYDALGILSNETMQQPALPAGRFNNLDISLINLKKKIKQFIKTKHGKHIQPYPPFSSKEVRGKPLFQWARENKLSEIKIPTRDIEIYSMELLSISDFPAAEIRKTVMKNIKNVEGDFRQNQILERWNKFFSSSKQSGVDLPAGRQGSNNLTMKQFNNFTVAKLRINCSSGTYVRSVANEMGNTLGTGAIALSILRTKVGKFTLNDSLRL